MIKEIYRNKLVWIVIFIQVAFTYQVWASNTDRVLLISSYNSSFPTYFQQIEGIKSVLDSLEIQLDIESLDSKRFNDSIIYKLNGQLLSHKLSKGLKYKAIIVSDDNALDFILQRQERLFKGVPIVFLGVNDINKAIIQNQNPLITGVGEMVSMEETINVMLKLFPEKKQLYVISDATKTGKVDLENFTDVIKKYEGVEVFTVSLENFSFEEMGYVLQQVDEEVPVLLLSALQDKNGNTMDFYSSLKLVKAHLKSPLFHLFQHGMGRGILGGKLVSHYEQGKSAAIIVSRLLYGEDISNIKVQYESLNHYEFDYYELEKYNVDKSLLPSTSVIINMPDNVFYKYRKTIILILCFLLVQLAIIVLLIINVRRKRKAQKDLVDQVSEYQSLNEEYVSLNEQYQSINEELNTKNNDLLAAEEELRANLEELAESNRAFEISEERFKLAAEASNNGVWDWNLITNEVYFSPVWKQILGYEDDELLNVFETWKDNMYEEDVNEALAHIDKYIKGESVIYRTEFRMKHKNGKLKNILSQGLMMRDSNGKAYRMIGSHEDLTSRYHYEENLKAQIEENLSLYEEYKTISEELILKNEALIKSEDIVKRNYKALEEKTQQLIESEEKYRLLFNNINEAFALHEIITDDNDNPTDFIYRDVNPVFLKNVGLRYEDLVGKKATELFPGIKLTWIDRYGKVALTGQSDYFLDHSSKLGKSYDVHVFCPKTGFFGAIFKDVTETLKAEKELMAERERISYVLEGTKAGTWDWDIEKDEIVINERWANIIGYKKDEVGILSYREWMKSLHEDDIIRISSTLGKVFSREIDYYDVEYRQKHKNGNYLWLHARGDIMEWTGLGKPLRMCGIHLDITSRKEAELKVIESEKRFKTIFDKSRTIMVLVNPATLQIVDVNDSAILFYGYTKEEFLKLTGLDIAVLSFDELRVKIRVALEKGKNYFSTKHKLKSGEIRNVDIYLSLIDVDHKKMLHIIIIDTTKAVEAEYQLRKVNQRFIGLENIIHYSANSINDLLDFTLKQVIDYTQSDTGAVYHYDEDKNLFVLNNFSNDVRLSLTFDSGNNINNLDCLSRAVRLKEAVIINDPKSSYPFIKEETADKFGAYKSIAIPVLENDKVVSIFWLGSKTNQYSKFHVEQVMLLLETAWILVERQRLQDQNKLV
ncbi:ABC transporter substrate binding protein [Plebeiibacterium sediminum]|uniref:histidine kinase n=1 Tax=Plebeiibacterium sediminum TaxID=2992112 RepID=A0AAE3M1H0_9BACT|nr:ABC transporter substrate binding protein [Plebeiobacterium sediminum]MCW3785060.1 PAS domain S-box protein [Plebeiobacterium sediminum]